MKPFDPTFERGGPPSAGQAGGTMTLADALRAAADYGGHQQPPPAVSLAVQAALHERLAQRQATRGATAGGSKARLLAAGGPRLWSSWSGTTAAFASVAIGSVVLLVLAGGPPPGLGGSPGATVSLASDFVPVLPPERWPADTASAASPAFIVRTELPGQRLAALGLPFDPAHAGDRRPAELLVHPSGEVLAVRIVP